jgi:hypothetical protein
MPSDLAFLAEASVQRCCPGLETSGHGETEGSSSSFLTRQRDLISAFLGFLVEDGVPGRSQLWV